MSDLRICLALVLSLLVHGVLGYWMNSDSIKYDTPNRHSIHNSTMTFNLVVLRTNDSGVVGVRQGHASEHLSAPQGEPTRVATQSVVPILGTSDVIPWSSNEFLSIHDVDIPATPVGEWVIDFSTWPPGTSRAIVVDMWISASGELEHWELVSDMPDRQMAENSLRLLGETPINPARRNGQRVASFRRIEITVDVLPPNEARF